ncbi:zinc finger protein 131 [Scyliorhinus canicula]|uniref:zinc finger protein 131 n=1 Tax=Scyliorhinus canicula TaxID=7830 RepID=UPI0018F39CD6|nr:zinc finger protein 131 [Scyliorhinus canicula]XP_038661850.1 zinc finger protein 131 [Scyliorhinus canicula]XP_038661851.1 zinc finger protein 131 [Scyliorhinus canicula]XP_038661852.1 zinc finger protein 131 [Scyliorhinus canicula]
MSEMAAEEVLVDHVHEVPSHYKVVLDRLNEQRQQEQFTDITLIVDGHHFKAHKAVLAACSQFFCRFFQDFREEPLVEIEGVSNLAFRHLIEFTYTAKLMLLQEDEASDVWKAAEYLQMEEAMKALNNRNHAESPDQVKTPGKRKAKKRTIAETSNVITETLPSIQETETVEIDQENVFAAEIVEINAEEMEEDARAAVQEAVENLPTADEPAQPPGDDVADTEQPVESALALLADITSKYQQDELDKELEKEGERESAGRSREESETSIVSEDGIHIVEVLAQGDKLFCCEKCNRSFRLFYHFKEHLKVHSGENYICHLCSKQYTRESAWKQHLSSHREEEGGNKKARCVRKVHVCQYCEKQFDHVGHFKEHLRKHTGEKPFECPNCHERFARNSTLKCHLVACRTSVGAKKGRKKMYECQVCSSVFPSWDQFKNHLAVHTGEKPNHCTICDMWFMRACELRQHVKDVHGAAEQEVGEVTEIVVPVEVIDTETLEGETIIEQVTV